MSVQVKRPTIHIAMQFNSESSVYTLPAAVERLQKVMNTIAAQHPELKIKAVRVS